MRLNIRQNIFLGAVLMVCFAVPRFLDTHAWIEVFFGVVLFLGVNEINNRLDKLKEYDR